MRESDQLCIGTRCDAAEVQLERVIFFTTTNNTNHMAYVYIYIYIYIHIHIIIHICM